MDSSPSNDLPNSIIVITDPHGCYNTFVALIDKLPKDQKIALGGDLVDRGPRSAQIVKLVRERGYDCVMGNHEFMMVSALLYNDNIGDFVRNGGQVTLESYGIDSINNLEAIKNNEQLQSDLLWMDELPYYLEYPDVKDAKDRYLLVTHSSAHPVWHRKDSMADGWNDFTFKNSMIWNRVPNIKAIPGVYNVFGHTPHGDNPRIKDCYANIDTGCCYINYKKDGLGKLTALQFPELTIFQQENIDMEPTKEKE